MNSRHQDFQADQSDSQKAAQILSLKPILAHSGRFAKPLRRMRGNAENCGSDNRQAGRNPVITGRLPDCTWRSRPGVPETLLHLGVGRAPPWEANTRRADTGSNFPSTGWVGPRPGRGGRRESGPDTHMVRSWDVLDWRVEPGVMTRRMHVPEGAAAPQPPRPT